MEYSLCEKIEGKTRLGGKHYNAPILQMVLSGWPESVAILL